MPEVSQNVDAAITDEDEEKDGYDDDEYHDSDAVYRIKLKSKFLRIKERKKEKAEKLKKDGITLKANSKIN